MKRLVLPCHALPSTILSVDPDQLGLATVRLSIANEEDRAGGGPAGDHDVWLTDEGARLLFNWLGVFLHRKGPG